MNILRFSEMQRDQKCAAAADSTALVLAGRGVVVNPSNMALNPLTIMDNAMYQLGMAFGESPREMQVSMKKVITPLLPLFQLMEKTIGQMEFDEQAISLLQSKLQESVRGLAYQTQQHLRIAGVKSLPELREKQKTIDGLKSLAWQRFHSDGNCIKARIELDEGLVVATQGDLSKKDQATIQQYWQMAGADPQGYQKHEEMEEKLCMDILATFNQGVVELLQEPDAQQSLHGDYRYESLEKSLHVILSKREEQIRKERNTQTEEEAVKTDYMLLKTHILGPICVNMFVRKLLEKRATEKEAYVEQMMNGFVIWVTEQDIKLCQRAYLREMERLEKLRDRLSVELQQLEIAVVLDDEDQIKHKQHMVEIYQRFLREEEARAPGIFEGEMKRIEELRARDPRKYAESITGTPPDAIRKCMPKMTKCEMMIRKLYGLELDKQKKDAPDTHLDLEKLGDPVDYFFKQMREEVMGHLQSVKDYNQTIQIIS